MNKKFIAQPEEKNLKNSTAADLFAPEKSNMTKHFQRELEVLKTKLLELCATVDDTVIKAIESLRDRDETMARQVIDLDSVVDMSEVALEEECLKVLALHQPVATNLRFIIATMKINNDLERVADLAVNIAERSLVIGRQKKIDPPFDFMAMAQKSRTMLSRAIDSLIQMNTSIAQEVSATDDEVDEMNREVYLTVYDLIRKHPENTEILINYISVSRHLERIADYATNIAEDVIYLVEGKIIRHQPDDS